MEKRRPMYTVVNVQQELIDSSDVAPVNIHPSIPPETRTPIISIAKNNEGINVLPYIGGIVVCCVIAWLYQAGYIPSLRSWIGNFRSSDEVVKEKRYQFDSTKIFDTNAAGELTSFEEKENPQGLNLQIEKNIVADGESSIALVSNDHDVANASVNSPIANLSEYTVIKALFYVPDDENGLNIDKLLVRIGARDDSVGFQFVVNNLKKGWNTVSMAKNQFVEVINKADVKPAWTASEKVVVELASRPKTKSTIYVDRIWAEKNEEYKQIFYINNKAGVAQKAFEKKTYISMGMGSGTTGYISGVKNASNFSYTVKIIPQMAGQFGIIARGEHVTGSGYYFMMEGTGSKAWKVYKVKKNDSQNNWVALGSGKIFSSIVEKNKPIWLRIDAYGSKLISYVSFDGINYIIASEIRDPSYTSGEAGVFVNTASVLIESIDLSQ